MICLDTRAFRLTQGPQETFGCVPECRKGIWDISGSRADVRDASIWHAGFSRFTAVRETHNGAQPSANSDDAASLDDSEGTDGDIDEPDWFIDTDEEDHEDGSESNTVLVDDDSESGTPSLAEQQMIYESMTSVSLNHNDVIQEIAGSDHGAAQFGTSPPCRPSGKVWPERTETCVATPDKLSEPRLPRCAIIYTSETDIRFLQDPMKGPTVAFQQPLTQNLPPNLQWLDRFDRLNILAQIPELGIVAVATQTGRIALLTLTRMTMTKHLAFRLDTILPLRSQEDEGRRPDVPLLGLAIGPIQGREMTLASIESDGLKSDDRRESWRGVESSRRYRLMLTYYDHTVLSYEIGRPSTAASSTEDELLVL